MESNISKKKAFTLLECMLTLAIIVILTTIAVPLYSHHIAKANNTNARLVLLSLASKLEDYYAMHQYYSGANVNASTPGYRIDVVLSSNHYNITAIPIKKSECIIRLDDTGGIRNNCIHM